MKRLTYLCLVSALAINALAHAATVRTVALSGQHAPGTPSGVSFSFLRIQPVLNDAGQTAFWAGLSGSGVVEFVNDIGIWATDRTGVLQLIARTGDPLEVAPGDFRTISVLEFVFGAGNSDGRRSGFNNLGQLAFATSFTDGTSGIFVSNRVAIPEPSTLTFAAMALLGFLNRRRSLNVPPMPGAP